MQRVFANRAKFDACLWTAKELRWLGWETFQSHYLQSVEAIQQLPRMGVVAYHLGRNIGLDCVKPDLHLVRLAWHYWINESHGDAKNESTLSSSKCMDLTIQMVEHLAEKIEPGFYQNIRCSRVFKRNGEAFDIQGKVFRRSDGVCYTNQESKVPVEFPYIPATAYVDVEEE